MIEYFMKKVVRKLFMYLHILFVMNLNLITFDQFSHSEVSQRELRDFELHWKVPVIKLSNTPVSSLDDIVPVINSICQLLWQKDVQRMEAA